MANQGRRERRLRACPLDGEGAGAAVGNGSRTADPTLALPGGRNGARQTFVNHDSASFTRCWAPESSAVIFAMRFRIDAQT